MGKKRAAAAIMATTTPVFPFRAAADETEPPHHFSDYGFDPQLLCFSGQQPLPGTKRPAARRHGQPQPPTPLEPAQFKLQKPISKKHQRAQAHRRGDRRWWRCAASAALLFFFRRPSSRPAGAAPSSSSCATSAASAPPHGPLYSADDEDSAGCACWSPAVRSGRLAAAELGMASVLVPYVGLRDVGLGGAGGVAPSMPIYLVT